MTSLGASSTLFEFAGETRDDSDLTYLRSRYLDTSAGRFITRDEWSGNSLSPISFNGWAYVHDNPLRYVDPSGRFSPAAIAQSYGFNSFDELLDAFERDESPYLGKRWGWLALLLQARPGDNVIAYYPDLQVLYPGWAIHYQGVLDYSSARGITFDGYTMPYHSLRQDVGYPYGRSSRTDAETIAAIAYSAGQSLLPGWRDTSAHVYDLRGSRFIDYQWEQTDLPDFRSIDLAPSGDIELGLGGGASLVADYFGNMYFQLAFGSGASIGLATYSEGYVAESFLYDVVLGERRRVTDQERLKKLMGGYCSSIGAADIIGASVALCPVFDVFGLPTEISAVLVYGMGLQFGVSAQGQYAWPVGTDRNLGWEWAFTYRRQGISRSDVEQAAMLQIGECEPY
jgi:RHS repeat-associated protein